MKAEQVQTNENKPKWAQNKHAQVQTIECEWKPNKPKTNANEPKQAQTSMNESQPSRRRWTVGQVHKHADGWVRTSMNKHK